MLSQVILSYMTNIEAGTSKVNKCKLLTHSPLEILPKNTFEACQVVFWSLSCYKELKLTIKPFTGHGHGQKVKFCRIFWGLKVTAVLLSLLPSFFAFLASIFFSFTGHLVDFILVGKVFTKVFRVLGLMKGKVGG